MYRPYIRGSAAGLAVRGGCGGNSLSKPSQPRPQILLEKLRGQADLALAKLRGAAISGNPSIKGASREEAIREFMRCFLPRSCVIGHGEIFSADNDMSRQVDVIIHDNLFSPVFGTDDGGILVPCEAVYGTAEVKTRLDREGWELALENVASVKRIERAPADDWGLERASGPGMDILPNTRLQFSSRFTASG